MSKPTQDYLDGYLRGLTAGRADMMDKLVEIADEMPADEYGFKKDICRWLKQIQVSARQVADGENK
jgi:hypothetical protein